MSHTKKFETFFGQHRGSNVIFCKFLYDKEIISRFKLKFPSAKWSNSNKAWYLQDVQEIRIQLNLPIKNPIDNLLAKIPSPNQQALLKFEEVLKLKAYSKATIKTYLTEFSQFLKFLNENSVNEVANEDVNKYLYNLVLNKLSENQIHSRINAIKGYFKYIDNKELNLELIIRPKKKKMLPNVLSKTEIKKIFSVIENDKHLLMLKLCYGMGLRVSEIINLKVSNIDSSRMMVHIENAKGKKDRYVNLPQTVLTDLRVYYLKYKPDVYLFGGQYGGQYTARSVQSVFKRALKKANIQKQISIHGLRHSFATHLLEKGTDMVFIQKLLGHQNMKTTEIYAKVSTKILKNVESPLDDL